MRYKDDDDSPYHLPEVAPKPVLKSFTITLACGHVVEYQTYETLAPLPGDSMICWEDGKQTRVKKVE